MRECEYLGSWEVQILARKGGREQGVSLGLAYSSGKEMCDGTGKAKDGAVVLEVRVVYWKSHTWIMIVRQA